MVLVVLCPGKHGVSTGSGSGFKASQKMGQRLKVSSSVMFLKFTIIYIILPLAAMSFKDFFFIFFKLW